MMKRVAWNLPWIASLILVAALIGCAKKQPAPATPPPAAKPAAVDPTAPSRCVLSPMPMPMRVAIITDGRTNRWYWT